MKNIAIVLPLLLGVFILTGYASANTAEELQPAGANVGVFDSIKIGDPINGGVTFFNGTIINVGTDTPVTFGDDVRIDGAIWRGTANSGQPVIVEDNLEVHGILFANKFQTTLTGSVSSDSIQPSIGLNSKVGSTTSPFTNGYFDKLSIDSIKLNSNKEYGYEGGFCTEPGKITYNSISGSFFGCAGYSWKEL